MFPPATNLPSSERSLQNRYLPLGLQLWIMYSEFDRHSLYITRLMFVVGFVSPFPQEVSGTVNRDIWNDELVSEKGPRRTTCLQ